MATGTHLSITRPWCAVLIACSGLRSGDVDDVVVLPSPSAGVLPLSLSSCLRAGCLTNEASLLVVVVVVVVVVDAADLEREAHACCAGARWDGQNSSVQDGHWR